ncbi:hypothetical protein BH09BAC2_BH09BAC2_10720 [soil metagenome]
MALTLFEKLQLTDEKNILIQGLPSTIEKQFSKVSFSKNVTALLKIRRIEFALVFALNQKQLNDILDEVLPSLHINAKLWVAFPKSSSKVVSDLNRCCTWDALTDKGYESGEQVDLDYVWAAMKFGKTPSQINTQIEPMKVKRKKLAENSLV